MHQNVHMHVCLLKYACGVWECKEHHGFKGQLASEDRK